jgi:prepilin-type N-terminal cleavage/methylation domain-containing protein
MSVNAVTMQMASPYQRKQAGFTLVELMIAISLGLIVVLAAVGFVISVAKANSENIQVTRLTQELRSISEVVGREVRRARYVTDPVGLIGSGGTTHHDTITVNVAADCIVFAYDEPPDPPSPGGTVSRSIRLDSNSVFLNPAGTDCTGGNALNTPEVVITNLRFTNTGSRVDIELSGRLANAPTGSNLAAATRTFNKTVYVRSGRVN